MGPVLGKSARSNTTVQLDLGQEEVPVEIIESVLRFLPAKDCLLNCSLVCKQWRDIIHSKSFWKARCDDDGIVIPLQYHQDIDWKVVNVKKPFGRNLVKNWNAEEGVKHWKVLEDGGNNMRVETNVCTGADPLPEELLLAGCKKAWVTSYQIARKFQVINLLQEGLTAEMIDKIKPKFYFSEWWAGRFDCACHYEVLVELLGDAGQVLSSQTERGTEDQWQGRTWKKVEFSFTSYVEGVRKIRITHAGSDRQFWAGHYGAKFTGTTLKVLLES